MFDIDRFKNVNDTYGHLIGGRVLMSKAKTAAAAIREGDVLLRYGGGEFLCIKLADQAMYEVKEAGRNRSVSSWI